MLALLGWRYHRVTLECLQAQEARHGNVSGLHPRLSKQRCLYTFRDRGLRPGTNELAGLVRTLLLHTWHAAPVKDVMVTDSLVVECAPLLLSTVKLMTKLF